MNPWVVGQAFRLPQGRLAPGSWSQCALKNVEAFHEPPGFEVRQSAESQRDSSLQPRVGPPFCSWRSNPGSTAQEAQQPQRGCGQSPTHEPESLPIDFQLL